MYFRKEQQNNKEDRQQERCRQSKKTGEINKEKKRWVTEELSLFMIDSKNEKHNIWRKKLTNRKQ